MKTIASPHYDRGSLMTDPIVQRAAAVIVTSRGECAPFDDDEETEADRVALEAWKRSRSDAESECVPPRLWRLAGALVALAVLAGVALAEGLL